MAPSVTLNNTSGFNSPSNSLPAMSQRTLLLSPPSLSSHPDALTSILANYDRSLTDIQMLDRLSLGLVSLSNSTYDTILILSDPDGTRLESTRLINRGILGKLVRALRAGGNLRSQDGTYAGQDSEERREAILAGLVLQGANGMTKPNYSSTEAVPLRFNKRKITQSATTAESNSHATQAQSLILNGRQGDEAPVSATPAGVGFVDFSDDFDDDELIDEDTLLEETDLARPIVQPAECRPKAGKRRRACKDCTCGLKEKLEAGDASRRNAADSALNAMKLDVNDLAEVDFTVQGKVGSCGNCSLGDAFRCDGCPYIGLPAFKPGEEVRLLNNDAQL